MTTPTQARGRIRRVAAGDRLTVKIADTSLGNLSVGEIVTVSAVSGGFVKLDGKPYEWPLTIFQRKKSVQP